MLPSFFLSFFLFSLPCCCNLCCCCCTKCFLENSFCWAKRERGTKRKKSVGDENTSALSSSRKKKGQLQQHRMVYRREKMRCSKVRKLQETREETKEETRGRKRSLEEKEKTSWRDEGLSCPLTSSLLAFTTEAKTFLPSFPFFQSRWAVKLNGIYDISVSRLVTRRTGHTSSGSVSLTEKERHTRRV